MLNLAFFIKDVTQASSFLRNDFMKPARFGKCDLRLHIFQLRKWRVHRCRFRDNQNIWNPSHGSHPLASARFVGDEGGIALSG